MVRDSAGSKKSLEAEFRWNRLLHPGVCGPMNPPNGAEATVQRVDFFSRIDEARALLCSFFWSDEFGLCCSVPQWLTELEATGIAILKMSILFEARFLAKDQLN